MIKKLNTFFRMNKINPRLIQRKPNIIKRTNLSITHQNYDVINKEGLKGKNLIDTLSKEDIESMQPNFKFNLPKGEKDRIYIIGGGSSVLQCDLKSLIDGDVMAVNRAIEYVDNPTYFITMDYTFIRDKVNLKILNKAMYKIFVLNMSGALSEHRGVYYDNRFGLIYQKMFLFNKVFKSQYTVADDTGFGLTEEKFAHGENSGFCALQTAILLGYKEIILVGFDLSIINKTHFHGGYGQNPGSFVKKLSKYVEYFENALRLLPEDIRIRIYNASVVSPINKIVTAINPKYIHANFKRPDKPQEPKFGDRVKPNLEPKIKQDSIECKEVKEEENMTSNTLGNLMVVGYYTINTPYEEEAKKTIASCKRLFLNHDIIGVPNLGNWQANTRYKAKFMLDMLDKHKDKRLLYIDCDAVINELPVLFKNYSADIAVRWQDFRWRVNECLSGTIYMENNERTKKLCEMWFDINNSQGSTAKGFEQWNLGTAIETMKATDGLIAKNLPPEYCQFDLIEKIYPNLKKGMGVIQHYQKSRQFRGQIG